jgi:aerobic carbon-monoxide dehydrogenase large subunit
MTFTWLRREDARLTSGQGQYVSDLVLSGQQFAAFVRSPYAHARFRNVQLDQARAAVGVVTVLTAKDLPALPMPLVNPLVNDAKALTQPLFADEKVSYLGEPIALVIADTDAHARAAAELISADWQELPIIADHDVNQAPLISIEYRSDKFSTAEAAAQRRQMQQVFVSHTQPRVAATPMEPRSAIAHWQHEEQLLNVWLPTQTPYRSRTDLARALGLTKGQVRVIAPDVGGAFGARASIYPEDIILAAASRQLNLPLKWIGSRSEEFLISTHGRGAHFFIQGWLSQQRLVQIEAQFNFTLGAWLPFSAAVPARNAARIVPGLYAIEAVSSSSQAYLSNAAAVNIYRGAGRPEACMALERLMDQAANVLQIDPLAFRLQHCLAPEQFAHQLPSGAMIDSADPKRLLQETATLFEYQQTRAAQARDRSTGQLVGVGIALYAEPCGEGWEYVQIDWHEPINAANEIDSDPICLTIVTGATAQGQGRETQVAALASTWLNVPANSIRVVTGDTAMGDKGNGALASRSTAIGGSALFEACQQINALKAQNGPLPWSVKQTYTASAEAWSSGCVMCEVTVDVDTGVLEVRKIAWVDDAGAVLDPVLTRGQLLGGLAQGLGQGLMEQLVYDQQGQLITGSLMDYALPRADQMPTVLLGSICTPTSANLLGAKGVGEAGCVGIPAALLNAAIDALSPLGIKSLELPLTSNQLWQAIADHESV